ncbi:hypothetical protein V9K67_06590 [Paraflavisolibacter sp. H34]|uniref:hypothetical protein n=1 Tax=Huijunlia imazamoxiresistens TaxID=3127457 RepID=UPI00301B1BF4
MKTIRLCLFLLALIHCGASYSQNPFYDARQLKTGFRIGAGKLAGDTTRIVLPDAPGVFQLLKSYAPYKTDSKDSIAQAFADNPFIVFDPNFTHAQLAGGGPGLFASISGLDVTKIANALADIMIERSKQELTVAFFDRFKKFATRDNPEFQILFPKTTDNLNRLATYAYPQMLPSLRTSFFEDIKQVTYHLDDVLELPRYRHLLNNFPEIRIAVRSIRLMQDIEDGTATAADVLKRYALFGEWQEEGSRDFKNMGSAVKLAALFSESLRYQDTTRIWVSAREAKEELQNEVYVRIFMGLLYQQIKKDSIRFYPAGNAGPKYLADIIKEQKNNLLLFQNKLSEFVNLSEKVQNAYNDLKHKMRANVNPTSEEVSNYISISIDITDYGFSVAKIFDEDMVADQYIQVVKKANALYKDSYSEQYTKLVNDAIDLLNDVADLAKNSNKAETVAKPAYAWDKMKALKKIADFTEKAKPYGLFMANMVEAENERGVKAALENVILPVGSSSIKKYARGNVSVQSYLGAFLTTSQRKTAIEGTWSDKFGVTAPVGISWTPGCLSWEKGGALSLFTALFDIGAIVDYKLQKEPDPTSANPNATVLVKDYKVELGQIFSPGAYAVYGFGCNLPLALGFGAQYGPGLSKIESNNPTVLKNPSWRWNLFLAVDLPLINLTHKPKRS